MKKVLLTAAAALAVFGTASVLAEGTSVNGAGVVNDVPAFNGGANPAGAPTHKLPKINVDEKGVVSMNGDENGEAAKEEAKPEFDLSTLVAPGTPENPGTPEKSGTPGTPAPSGEAAPKSSAKAEQKVLPKTSALK